MPAAHLASNDRHVYVVDDDVNFSAQLCAMISQAGGCATAYESGLDFVRSAPILAPGVLLLGCVSDSKTAVDVLNAMKANNCPHVAIVVADFDDVAIAVSAMKAGALDILPRQLDAVKFCAAIDIAQESIDATATRNLRRIAALAAISKLSPRETSIFHCVAQGDSNKVIARDLGLSTRTVEMFRSTMMQKIGARHVPDVVRVALDSNLLL
jgi:FixJ family two-component response regulator